MNRWLPTEDRAVAKVVAVVLMLGIVALLSGTAAVMFLDFGQGLEEQPMAAVHYEQEPGQPLVVELAGVLDGQEFYVVDGDMERLGEESMERAGDRVVVDVPCHHDLSTPIRVLGVHHGVEGIVSEHQPYEIGVTYDDAWQYDGFDDRVRAMAYHDGTVFAGSYDDSEAARVHAIDAETGTIEWEYTGVANTVRTVAYHDGSVYVGTGYDDPEIHVLDPADGSLEASVSLDASQHMHLRDLAFVDDRIYVATQDGTYWQDWNTDAGHVVVLDDDLTMLDSHDVGSGVNGLATDGDALYTAQMEGTVRRYDLAGSSISLDWSRDLNATGDLGLWGVTAVRVAEVEGEDALYSAAHDGPVTRHDVATGDERWNTSSLGGQKWGLRLDERGNVYVGNDDGQLQRLSPTGCVVWTFDGFDSGTQIDELAIGDDGAIYGGDDDTVVRVQQDVS